MTIVEDFASLFPGRLDIFGAEHGECVKAQLQLIHFINHLTGGVGIGIYPLVAGRVHWGCSDIDSEDSTLAWRLSSALTSLGLASFVELTRSAHYHVWVFAEDWVSASEMRNALLVAHKLAGIRPTEVNPKSVHGGAQGNGNYVRLPYFSPDVDQGRRVVLPRGSNFPLTVEQFVKGVLATRNSPEAIHSAASKWREPAHKDPIQRTLPNGSLNALTSKLDGLGFTIFRDGPLEGNDRSTTLARLAHLCAEAGLSPDETFSVLSDSDSRWGKFHLRPDGEEQLWRIVENSA